MAENEYLDVIAHSTDAGEVVVYASHLAVFDCDEKKLRKQRIVSSVCGVFKTFFFELISSILLLADPTNGFDWYKKFKKRFS